LRILSRSFIHRSIRLAHCLAHGSVAVSGSDQDICRSIGSQTARRLTRGCPTHAIADDEDTSFRPRNEGILIGAADAAPIGDAGGAQQRLAAHFCSVS
jgi:hypothetical protein